MKAIGKFPIEVFCYDYEDKSNSSVTARNQQYCRYIKGTCMKPRKSEPEIKVGICSLGATVNKGNTVNPVIICPHRFREETLFETIREKYLSSWSNVKWVKEVSLGVGGSVDFVAVEVDKNDVVRDFLCVEIQAAGTTGTPFPYVRELLKEGHYTGKKHSYGINWANEFSKTMMQQAFKKGKIVEHWHRKIVFVVQDLALEYLQKATDCSGLTAANDDFPIDFCTFKLDWKNNEWALSFDQIRSTNVEGIGLILGGAKIDSYPSEDDFIRTIMNKGIADGVLANNSFTKKYLMR